MKAGFSFQPFLKRNTTWRHAGMTQGFAWGWQTVVNERRLNYKHKLATCCVYLIVHVDFSLPGFTHSHHDHFVFCLFVFFFNIFYISTNTHLFTDWLVVACPGFGETFGEIVCVDVCVFFLSISLDRGEAAMSSVTLFPSLSPSLQLIDALLFIPQQGLRLSLCWLAKCYSQRHFRTFWSANFITVISCPNLSHGESCVLAVPSVAAFVSKVSSVVKPLSSSAAFCDCWLITQDMESWIMWAFWNQSFCLLSGFGYS